MAPASAEGGGLFDFSSVTANSTQSTSRIQWIRSAMDATEQARRTGKPLLILVNNRNSPPGQSIESTLVLQPEFKKLTEENYVPLYMDFSDKATADSDFYQAFKDRLNVRGYPTVLVTLPDGVEVMRLSGYKNENEVAYMLKLRESVASSQRAIEARRKRLLPGGYRAWTDKKGVVVYAKLDKADANMLHLTTEWGTTFTTFTNRLSAEDQAWIESERAKRQPAQPDAS
ncbi:thioredoxin fold domain-containing protein [Verrucomicrobium spinosum]|nr:thioredoxin fold domain-containing protein [Verrucomicrobium spinosum]